MELTKYLKLPFRFDKNALIKDFKSITDEMWKPQIYKMNYEGEWTSLALLSKQGQNNTFAFASADGQLNETILLKNCPYFRYVISKFKCPIISVRLLRLNSGAYIKPHKDYKLGYEDNNFRIHIPVITNEQVEFIIDGEQLKMLPGECWYTNVNLTHSVHNKSLQDRIHLVLDGERNDWSDKIFFSLAPKESFNLSKDSKSITIKIIEELKLRNEPSLNELISKLQKSLAN